MYKKILRWANKDLKKNKSIIYYIIKKIKTIKKETIINEDYLDRKKLPFLN